MSCKRLADSETVSHSRLSQRIIALETKYFSCAIADRQHALRVWLLA